MIGRRFDEIGAWAAGEQRVGRAPEPRLDALSRALVAPLSRRRAFGVVAGAALAARAIRTLPAEAAASCPPANNPTATKKCSIPAGDLERFVCVPPTQQCCNTDRCAAACSTSWKDCANGGSATAACNDTPRMCFDSGNGAVELGRYQFCSTTATTPQAPNTCSDPHRQTFGWCCPPGHGCGNNLGECKCPSKVTCPDGRCCPKDHYCDGNECKKWCDEAHTQPRCGYDCCSAGTRCSGGLFPRCECKPPLEECGTGCCSPKDTTKDPNWLQQIVDGWRSVMQGSSANHGGGNQRTLRAAAPAAGAAGALDVLAAVTAQRTAAYAAFTDGHRDQRVGSAVKVGKVSLPAVQSGAGIDAGSAKALNAVLAVEVKASALIMAAATALARSRAAAKRHNRSAARRQLLASARFADQAASSLGKVGGLRSKVAAAMKAGQVTEVFVTADQIAALQRSVRSGGLPTQIAALLAGLGIKGHDQARVRAGITGAQVLADQLAGPVLVAPFSDSAQTKATSHVISELRAYSRRARSSQLVKGH